MQKYIVSVANFNGQNTALMLAKVSRRKEYRWE